jgi:hypothetical protein
VAHDVQRIYRQSFDDCEINIVGLGGLIEKLG